MSESSPANDRIMFSFWDGGWGHFTRVMALATEAYDRGYEIGMISSPKFVEEIGATGIASVVEVIPNRNPNIPAPIGDFPYYSHAFRHAQRQLGLRFDDIDWLKHVTNQEVEAIGAFKPSVVINDYRDTTRTAAQVNRVPVVGITHSSGNVHGKAFGWWVEPPTDANLPDCRNSFNVVRKSYGLPAIMDERELFCGDINLIPSIPEIDPLVEYSANSHYIGKLGWEPNRHIFMPAAAPLSIKSAFSYVGEKTRPQYGYEEMLTEVILSHPDMGFYVVGEEARYQNMELRRQCALGRVTISNFIAAEQATRRSDIVLTHGGHETTLIALSCDKPVLGIGTYHTDGSNTLKEVERQGAGIMLPHSEGPLAQRKAIDLGPNIDVFGHWQTDLNASTISSAMDRILSDLSYASNATRLGEKLRSLGGAGLAMDIIENQFLR